MYWRGGTRVGALGGLLARLRALGLHADAALGGQVRLDAGRLRRTTGPSGIALARRPSSCSAWPGSTTSPIRCSGACSSTSRSTSACRSGAQPVGARGEPGAAVRRRLRARPAGSGEHGAGVLARPRPGLDDLLALASRLLGAEPGASGCSRSTRARPAWPRSSRSRRRRPARRSSSSGSSPARSAAPRRA